MNESCVLPTQFLQTELESIHLTHSWSMSMLDLCQQIWILHINRSKVQMAQNCRQGTKQSKDLKAVIGKQHSFQKKYVVEPNEEVQLDFAGPLPDELNKDEYILGAKDKWSKSPMATIVSNTTVDIAMKFMQCYIVNNGLPRKQRCDKAQNFRAKNFQKLCKAIKSKLLFTTIDRHKSIGVEEGKIFTLTRRLRFMRKDKTNTPLKLASDLIDENTSHHSGRINKKFQLLRPTWDKTQHPVLNIATISTPDNLNWENAKHTCSDPKSLKQPPLPTEVKHDL